MIFRDTAGNYFLRSAHQIMMTMAFGAGPRGGLIQVFPNGDTEYLDGRRGRP